MCVPTSCQIDEPALTGRALSPDGRQRKASYERKTKLSNSVGRMRLLAVATALTTSPSRS